MSFNVYEIILKSHGSLEAGVDACIVYGISKVHDAIEYRHLFRYLYMSWDKQDSEIKKDTIWDYILFVIILCFVFCVGIAIGFSVLMRIYGY